MCKNEYNKDINKLFSKWIECHANDDNFVNNSWDKIEKDSFWYDGIIDYECYSKAKIRILFIAKEADAKHSNHEEASKPHSCLDWYNNLIYPQNYSRKYEDKVKMREKIARMAYYILNMSPEIDEEKRRIPTQEEYLDALKYVAIMNINKRGGSSSSKWKMLKSYVEDYGEKIKAEIEIIKPDIIICLGTRKLLQDILNTINIQYIDMWHPGIWGRSLKKYDNAPKYVSDFNVNRYMNEFFERAKTI